VEKNQVKVWLVFEIGVLFKWSDFENFISPRFLIDLLRWHGSAD